MQNFKDRWDITSGWQLIFPILGLTSLIFSSYLIGNYILISTGFSETDTIYIALLAGATLLITVFLLFITLKLFNVLEKKWKVAYRWELIAIFIAFAVTGSTSARISDPIISFLGLHKDTSNAWMYWFARILLIFPVYQVLLLLFGWIFGQFKFFWEF